MDKFLDRYHLLKLNQVSDFHSLILVLFSESTQTVQALQYSTVDGPLTASKDLEIKSLKEEIEKLRKQVAGNFLRVIINLV
jgi:hypothetical protein